MDTKAGTTPVTEALHARAMERNAAFSGLAEVIRNRGLDNEILIEFSHAILDRQRHMRGRRGKEQPWRKQNK